ncbi:alpha/beta fold hydrolase [Vibrio cholerae]|uniref:alpha/beta fold hydrolase n=1 Tax=Vibrio cholerae TaxID=666 RepID=UPI0006E6C360|nr:alpha/beta hydrolase [Vibrio cholerae]EGQ8444972.1 alpha/beta fold hydrolase [Vibrio cholerae]EGR2424281.1 alpha/beta hydrolase [Vibrio cholerae]EHE0026440.1 alpha/beta hydrolase [Vibrio cholerae]EJL6659266.1 alpha/beta hydrolase [Vibrio cholerae]EJU9689661.1 alpha/beta hydrolase [Vibrio cholerae]
MKNRNGYIGVNGSEIYYELSGNPEGEPLLMLHGGLGSLNELSPIHKYVAADYQLISIDFRGHGKSLLGGLPLNYMQYQQDVQNVLSYLGIEKYSIFGFSDGGIVGYRLAAQEPERVSCLVTLGSQWRLEADDPSIELLSGLTAEFWVSRFADDVAFYEASNPKPDFPKLVDMVKAVWLDITETGYPDELVEKICCPTLVMRGDNDFLFSLNEAVALKSKIAGCSFANIPLTAHSSHQESPELVGEMLKQFMSQLKN